MKVKLCGVIPKVDEALKIPENTVERLLPKELMCTYNTLKKSENWLFKSDAM